MTPELIVLCAVVVLFVLLALEVPVALSLGISGVFGIYLISGERAVLGALGGTPFSSTNSYSLAVIPLFILMGSLAVHGRIAEHVFAIARHHLKSMPGGLGVATIAGCASFAAVTGSSIATAAIFAKMSVGQMIRNGYPPQLAAGLVAAAGTLGALIPPSVLLVFFGIVAGESIGKLLIAGIIPGLLGAVIYAVYIMFAARNIRVPDEKLAEELQQSLADTRRRRGKGLPYRGLVRIGILFLAVVGGIYTGSFTSNEAAGVGAIFALAILVWERRSDGLGSILTCVKDALSEAASTTGMIFLIVVGAGIFSYMLVLSGMPQVLTAWITALDVAPWVIVAAILILCVPLGMALDSFSIMGIVVPLTYPIVTGLGFDGIWYGVLIVKMCELGLITPPVGVGAFVVAGAAKEVPIEQVFRGIVPFVFLELLTVALIFAFPAIALWLPQQMVN